MVAALCVVLKVWTVGIKLFPCSFVVVACVVFSTDNDSFNGVAFDIADSVEFVRMSE